MTSPDTLDRLIRFTQKQDESIQEYRRLTRAIAELTSAADRAAAEQQLDDHVRRMDALHHEYTMFISSCRNT